MAPKRKRKRDDAQADDADPGAGADTAAPVVPAASAPAAASSAAAAGSGGGGGGGSSLGYNDRLKPGIWRGRCGDTERVDPPRTVAAAVEQLARLLKAARTAIVHTGAGISTSCGIPDFRGPHGVWTAEHKGLAPPQGVAFECARPSLTHMALAALVKAGLVTHVTTQNVDGLHRLSGIPLPQLAELHGNIFLERCDRCGHEYDRAFDVCGMGCQPTGRHCDRPTADGEGKGGGLCGGVLRDRTCDWDTPLPEAELARSEEAHRRADLVICVGTSLRINPAGRFPLKSVRLNGKKKPGALVIINLQTTPLDAHCTLRIHARCDDVFARLMTRLGIAIPDAPPPRRPPSAHATAAGAIAAAGATPTAVPVVAAAAADASGGALPPLPAPVPWTGTATATGSDGVVEAAAAPAGPRKRARHTRRTTTTAASAPADAGAAAAATGADASTAGSGRSNAAFATTARRPAVPSGAAALAAVAVATPSGGAV